MKVGRGDGTPEFRVDPVSLSDGGEGPSLVVGRGVRLFDLGESSADFVVETAEDCADASPRVCRGAKAVSVVSFAILGLSALIPVRTDGRANERTRKNEETNREAKFAERRALPAIWGGAWGASSFLPHRI